MEGNCDPGGLPNPRRCSPTLHVVQDVLVAPVVPLLIVRTRARNHCANGPRIWNLAAPGSTGTDSAGPAEHVATRLLFGPFGHLLEHKSVVGN